MSGLFIGDSPVDGRNLPAQWHRAVATISINGESPAYSHGGDQSAGFYGCGIQQATRLKRVPSIATNGIIPIPAAVSSGQAQIREKWANR